MKITNVHGVPDQFIRVAKNNKYSRGEADISVTTLIDSPRINLLNKINAHEITKDVTDMTFSMMGTAVHKMLEETEEKPNEVYEERLFQDVYDWTLSGAIDVQRYEANGSISIMDYKVCTAWAVMNDKPEWENQLNCYAWLVAKCKQRPVESLQIVAIIRDFNRRKSQRESDYPDANIQVIDIPIWDFDEQSKYVAERVLLHKNAQTDFINDLPLCSDEERWAKPAKWAVMKKGRKSAVKLFDDPKRAELFISDQKSATALYVEERPSELTRCCGNYCGVAQFCSQFREIEND